MDSNQCDDHITSGADIQDRKVRIMQSTHGGTEIGTFYVSKIYHYDNCPVR